jgi:HEAT repeat protein
MGDGQYERVVMDATGPGVQKTGQTFQASFQSQRERARSELRKRGSPAYDIRHYFDVSESIIAPELLGESGEAQAVPRIMELHRIATDAKEKRAAVNALARIADPQAVEQLQRMFREETDAKTRRTTLRALAANEAVTQVHSVVATMLQCLGDSDAAVRDESLKWLTRQPDSWRETAPNSVLAETRLALLRLLGDPDVSVGYHAIAALGVIGVADDIDALESRRKDLKPAAIPRLTEAIKRIRSRSTRN